MKKVKFFLTCILGLLTIYSICGNFNVVNAQSLTESIDDQLNNLDFSAIENFLSTLTDLPDGFNFTEYVEQILAGKITLDYSNIFSWVFSYFTANLQSALPAFIGIIAITLLCGLIDNLKSSYISDDVSNIIYFICVLSCFLLVSSQLFSIWKETVTVINTISTIAEIISPTLLTLMIASGGTVSAGVYKPAVIFYTNAVTGIVCSVILPLIALIAVFSLIGSFTKNVKLTKYTDLFSSVIKWIFGIVSAVFGLFITVQGITSAIHDGISLKATKYAISNMVPIVGGTIKDGFDLVVAGSILIKNSIGLGAIFVLFFIILSPVIKIAVISFLFKITASITETASGDRVSNLCASTSKCLGYVTASILIIGLMFFVTVLLMIISANAFV